MAKSHSVVCTFHVFSIHSSVDGHLYGLHVLTTVNNAAMNIGVHGSFLTMIFSAYMPRNGIAGSYGSASFKTHMLAEDLAKYSQGLLCRFLELFFKLFLFLHYCAQYSIIT